MPLQISFSNLEVQKLCECRTAAEKAFGKKAARKLRARLEDLWAAEKISDIPIGLVSPMENSKLIIELYPPYKLVLEPSMNPIPKTASGQIDWGAIQNFCVSTES